MFWYSKINQNFGVELSLFRWMGYTQHLTFFNANCDWAWDEKHDHHPQFMSSLEILNIMLFEFDIYYLHHRDEEPTKIPEEHLCKVNQPCSTLLHLTSPLDSQTSETQ